MKLKSVKWPLEKYEKYSKYERGRFVKEKEWDLFNKLKRREKKGLTTNFKTEKWRKVKGEIWRRVLKKSFCDKGSQKKEKKKRES